MAERRLRYCGSCKAPIFWLATRGGKTMPVDAPTVGPDDVLFDPATHRSHFSTCPHHLPPPRTAPEATVNTVRRIGSCIAGAGIGCIWWQAGWLTAVGVILLIWANNIWLSCREEE